MTIMCRFSVFFFLLAIVLLNAAAVYNALPTDEGDYEEITVIVQVLDPQQQPVAEAPVEVVSFVQPRFAMTGPDGKATITLLRGDQDQTVTVRITNGGFAPVIPPELRSQAADRYKFLYETYAVPGCFIVPVTGTEVSHTITLGEAVRVSGRLVNPSGASIASAVGVRGLHSLDMVMPPEDGVFAVNVRKNAPAELWIAGESIQLHSVRLTATQTAEDVDLGNIVITEAVPNATLKLTMNNNQGLHLASKMLLGDSLALISADSSRMFLFDVRNDGSVHWPGENYQANYDLPVPAGTYYIAPGSLDNRPFLALLESIRANRHAQLDAAGIPKVTVAAGQTESLAFDAHAAVAAIIQVGGDLAPD